MRYETKRKRNSKAEEKMFPWSVIIFNNRKKVRIFFDNPMLVFEFLMFKDAIPIKKNIDAQRKNEDFYWKFYCGIDAFIIVFSKNVSN